MQPLEHTGCAQFDEALVKKEVMKTDQGFYITFIEWNQVPPETVEQLKAQMEQQRIQQGIAPDVELKPFAIIGKCPFCAVDLVKHPPGAAPMPPQPPPAPPVPPAP